MLNTLSSRATFYDVIGYLVPGMLTIGIAGSYAYMFSDSQSMMRIIRAGLQHSFLSSIALCAVGYVLGHLMNSCSSYFLEKHLFANRFRNAKSWCSRLGSKERADQVRVKAKCIFGVEIESLTSFDLRIRMEERMPNATITGFSFLSFYGMSRTLALLTWFSSIPIAELARRSFGCWLAFAVAFFTVVILGFLFINQYLRFVEYYYDFLCSTLMQDESFAVMNKQ